MADLPRIYIEACPFIDMAKHKAEMSLEDKTARNCLVYQTAYKGRARMTRLIF